LSQGVCERADLIRRRTPFASSKIPIATTIIRTRRAYQISPQTGLSAEEGNDPLAAQEMERAYLAIIRFFDKVISERCAREAERRIFNPPIVPPGPQGNFSFMMG